LFLELKTLKRNETVKPRVSKQRRIWGNYSFLSLANKQGGSFQIRSNLKKAMGLTFFSTWLNKHEESMSRLLPTAREEKETKMQGIFVVFSGNI
jgi:hypothetical protein